VIGRTISHYKIFEKLGEGGTGVVYRAEDTKLKRTVALKFLSVELTQDPEAKRHFIQEAQAASALDHANICTVYEVDEVEEEAFIAMAYVDGISLQKKVELGPLDCIEAVTIAIQVAEGLREAHKKGLVHHNIEPGNVMLTSIGHAKIMDFGLAKCLGLGPGGESDLGLGTVMYMSPEQATKGDIDHRTDIWSLCAVLYEMVTGRAAFKEDCMEAVVHSILNEEPQSMASIQPGVPSVLERVVRKALAKNPGGRQQSMDELLAEFQSVRNELCLAAGSGPSVSIAQPSIAVLPFANITDDKEQEYFCDGIAEDITNYLARVQGLRVAALKSAFAFKGRHEDVRKIGRELGVEALLEGSVRKAGGRLRISAQLVKVADGYHVWSERYDRELKDVFAIQDEIAQQIVLALKLELTERDKLTLRKGRTGDVLAYDFYLRGRKFLYLVQRRSYGFAAEMFSRAIEKDPGYALAYAGMADSYSFRFMFQDSDKAHLEQSLVASQKALELNVDLAEGHAARGLALSLSKRYEEADEEFETAIRLNRGRRKGRRKCLRRRAA
jgi:TolB-like protein/predicted Ser/Thr protein kinase